MNFEQKIEELKKPIPFKFRIGQGIGRAETIKGRKVYKKYSVLWYIDARDAQERLDEVMWPPNRSRDHKDLSGKVYGGVGLYNDEQWIWKRDCGTESNTEKEKGQSSDSFKRACVNWGLGRFLYDLPRIIITKEEADQHKYDLTEYVKERHKDKLKNFLPREKPAFEPLSESWNKALEQKATISTIKKHYQISEENETFYMSEYGKQWSSTK